MTGSAQPGLLPEGDLSLLSRVLWNLVAIATPPLVDGSGCPRPMHLGGWPSPSLTNAVVSPKRICPAGRPGGH